MCDLKNLILRHSVKELPSKTFAYRKSTKKDKKTLKKDMKYVQS